MFQYRKRYEVTCDPSSSARRRAARRRFQYRKRYEVTCDEKPLKGVGSYGKRFNTASGMRSHVTEYEHDFFRSCCEVSIPQAV